ncbi:MAG: class I SAM-dependent methyltransferase [Acidimicrobiales bacterium]
MRFPLSRKQGLAVGGVAGVAAVGVVLTVVWRVSAGIVTLLFLQVVVLAALVLIRTQMSNGQRAVRREITVAMAGEVARLRSAVDEVAAASPLGQVLEVVGRDRVDTAQRFAKIGEVNRGLVRDIGGMRERLDEFARETKLGFLQATTDAWSLHNLVRLVDISDPYPAPGGWAVTPNTLVELVSLVLSEPRDLLVVECGSGTSTVWMAHCQRAKGGRGRVIALEHDAEFAEATRGHLRRLGLDNWAEVRDAPLVDLEIEGRPSKWYNPQAIADLDQIDLLLVDGPPWRTSDDARYPALVILAPKLANDAKVVLDDVTREPEKSIAERWAHEEHAGLTLVPDRRTDSAQVFRAVRSSNAATSSGGNGVEDGADARAIDADDPAEADAV